MERYRPPRARAQPHPWPTGAARVSQAGASDADLGIVPAYRALVLRRIEVSAFVQEVDRVAQGEVSVRESRWHPKHVVIRSAQLDPDPLPEPRRGCGGYRPPRRIPRRAPPARVCLAAARSDNAGLVACGGSSASDCLARNVPRMPASANFCSCQVSSRRGRAHRRRHGGWMQHDVLQTRRNEFHERGSVSRPSRYVP